MSRLPAGETNHWSSTRENRVKRLLPACLCKLLNNRTHRFSQVFTGLHRSSQSSQSSQVFTGLHRSSQVFTGLHRFSQVFTGFHRFSQVFTGFHRSSQVFTGLHRSSQVFTGFSQVFTGFFTGFHKFSPIQNPAKEQNQNSAKRTFKTPRKGHRTPSEEPMGLDGMKLWNRWKLSSAMETFPAEQVHVVVSSESARFFPAVGWGSHHRAPRRARHFFPALRLRAPSGGPTAASGTTTASSRRALETLQLLLWHCDCKHFVELFYLLLPSQCCKCRSEASW